MSLCFTGIALYSFGQGSDSTHRKGRVVELDRWHQRDTYMFSDGQRATATGHEAGSAAIGGQYIFNGNGEDTATLARKTLTSRSLRSRSSRVSTLSNRKIYNWKDGQSATPTGEQAASIGGGYAALGHSDESGKKEDLKKNSKTSDQ